MEWGPIEPLSIGKSSQLHRSASPKPFYINIESYSTDPKERVTYYDIELGMKDTDTLGRHIVTKRYSQIERFAKTIRNDFKGERFIADFPPKRWLWNTAPSFVKGRADALQKYFSSLTRVVGIEDHPAFVDFFGCGTQDSD